MRAFTCQNESGRIGHGIEFVVLVGITSGWFTRRHVICTQLVESWWLRRAKPIRSRLAAQRDAGSAGDEAEALLAQLDAEDA